MPSTPPTLAALAAVLALAPAANAQPYAADTVIAKLRPGRSASARAAARRAGVRGTVAVLGGIRARLLRVAGDPATVARRLSRTPGVRWAEPNWILRATGRRFAAAAATAGRGPVAQRAAGQARPNDARFGELYGLTAIGAPVAWQAVGLGGFPSAGGVPVGIVDTGIDARHEELAEKAVACGAAADGRVREGECEDEDGHGTHVAGTIGALANNGVGIAGVAFASPLIVCRALGGPGGSGTTADVAACLRWTHEQGAKVISMSLGGPESKALAAAARAAWKRGSRRGAVLVAAAGNDGDASTQYPAGLDEVVSVAAVGRRDVPADFSNHNEDVEIAAPGVDILSTQPGGGYVRHSGTSMATPHAAGAAALLWGLHPRSTAKAIRERLDAAALDLGAPGRDEVFGFGRLDLSKVNWDG